MAYSHIEMKAFKGLYLNQNSFAVPDGALEQADNCVITKDNVIEKRRGFLTYLAPGGGVTLNSVYTYQSTLLALYNTKMQYVTDSGGTDLTGQTVSLTNSRIGRFCESNGNLYFTSDNGPLKLEAYNSAVFKAGTPSGLDLRGKLGAANGPLKASDAGSSSPVYPNGSQVNYRIVFGRRDANNNLLLGAPSDILTVINRIQTLQSYSSTLTTVTVTTSSPHNLTTGMVVVTSSVSGTAGFAGSFVITVASSTTFTYTAGVSSTETGTLSWTATRTVNLEGTIPSEITSTAYFYQVYRSSQIDASSAAAPLDFKLIQEVALVAGDLAAEVFFYTDTIDDLFLGAELYTNPNSQEGELQANNKPPLCTDIAAFRNYVFYSNTTSLHLLNLAVTSTSTTYINAADWVEVQIGAVTRRYVARGGVGNSTVASSSVSGTGTLTITYTAHGFSNGDTVYVSNVAGGAFAVGTYTVAGVTANTFTITGTGTATSLDFQGVTNGTYPIFTLLAPGTSVSTGLDTTARALVKAINRDSSSPVYARYLSTPTDIPGKLYLQAKGFGSAINVRASSTATGQAFSPNLPTAFGSVVSTNDVLPNNIFYSKVGEPEAVPFENALPIGSRGKAILRIFALRDSLILLKEDGVYRLDGDSPANFTATPIDTTIICLVPNSAALLNNQVIFLSNQGVVMCSNSAVSIMSHRIEDPLTPIYTYSQLVAQTAGVACESQRLYLLSTLKPNTTVASTVWCYNTVTDSWTAWDKTFIAGCVGPNDTVYLVSTANTILKQRRVYNRTDFVDEAYSASIVTVAGDLLSATLTVSNYNPLPGDVIVYNGVLSIIATSAVNTGVWTVTFATPSNLVANTTATIGQAFTATIKFAPFTGGMTNRAKQFAQMTVRTRDSNVSSLTASFTTDFFGGSEVTTWKALSVSSNLGWGLFPWGFSPWGQANGIDLNFQTTGAAPIRIYVPLFAQRGAYIQCVLTHSTGGEPLNIQAVGYQVRGYGERVSR